MIGLALALAFPLGFLCARQTTAHLAYVAVYCYCFTFQSVYLTTAWVRGNPDVAFPADGDPSLPYLGVTATVYAAGFALVWLGGAARRRRARRAASPGDHPVLAQAVAGT